MNALSVIARWGRHDRACPLHPEPNLPGDERCTCGFSKAQVVAEAERREILINFHHACGWMNCADKSLERLEAEYRPQAEARKAVRL